MGVGVSAGPARDRAPDDPEGPPATPGAAGEHRARRRRARHRGRLIVMVAVCALVVIAIALALVAAAPRRAAAPAAPPPVGARGAATCTVGFYVESLHDSNVGAGTFGADLWAWSLCPDAAVKPLDTIEFTNANSVTKSFATTTPEHDGSQYSSVRITGQFRHDFTLTRYPFDTQRFAVQFEDSQLDTSSLVYSPDRANTACAPSLKLDDWAVHRCSLAIDGHAYATTFGDPSLPKGTTYTYARGTLSIQAKRSAPVTEYLKSTSVIYPSVLLVIISFFLMTEATNTLGARMSTSGGALFSVALSMKALSSQLNADNHFTMMDGIGLAALLCVVFAGGVAMWCQRQLDHGVPFGRVRSVSQRLGWATLAAFVGLNAIAVWLAVRA